MVNIEENRSACTASFETTLAVSCWSHELKPDPFTILSHDKNLQNREKNYEQLHQFVWTDFGIRCLDENALFAGRVLACSRLQ